MRQRKSNATIAPMAAERMAATALITLLVTGTATRAHAQEAPLQLTRLSGPITLDGKPDEPAWEQVPPLPLTMYTPVFRGQPTQRTEIRVAYDSENLYVAGRFYDTEPFWHPYQLALSRPLEW